MKKTMIISGATSGLGKSTALELANQNVNLILLGRNKEKGDELITELNEVNKSNYWFYVVNFSSIRSTKLVADEILKQHSSVDVLINNAGAVFSSFNLTKDGIEQTIATNHLGYFVLTLKLISILNKNTGRIVNVSSNSHYNKQLDFEEFTKEKKYFILDAYGKSKLANVLFTYSLVERLKHTGIMTNALHPGMVKTSIGFKAKGLLAKLGWWIGSRTKGVSIDEGIKSHLYLAISEEAKHLNGGFIYAMQERKSSEISYDKELQERLWQWSEQVTGLQWKEIK